MKVLVLGASLKEDRYSYKAIKKLLAGGFEVVALGNKPGKIDSVEIGTELVPMSDVYTVTLYLNPQNQKAYYSYIASLNPKRVIFNPGTENAAFQNYLTEHQIPYEEACTLVMLSMGVF